jgi:hypothetical protein
MDRSALVRSATAAALLLLAACAPRQEVGYAGPLPSIEARRALGALEGMLIGGGSMPISPDPLEVGPFVVGPHGLMCTLRPPGLGDGPLPPGTPRHAVYFMTDGDVAAFFAIASRPGPAGLAGPTSAEFERSVGRREAAQ